MELLSNLALGFGVAVTPTNLFFCFIGALLGTVIGVLPGIGPLATISILLPVTYQLQPVTALVMLAGVYYGAQHGGSTPEEFKKRNEADILVWREVVQDVGAKLD